MKWCYLNLFGCTESGLVIERKLLADKTIPTGYMATYNTHYLFFPHEADFKILKNISCQLSAPTIKFRLKDRYQVWKDMLARCRTPQQEAGLSSGDGCFLNYWVFLGKHLVTREPRYPRSSKYDKDFPALSIWFYYTTACHAVVLGMWLYTGYFVQVGGCQCPHNDRGREL